MKKITILSITLIIIALFSVVSFAESNTVDLKNELTQSFDKTKNTVSGMTNEIIIDANMSDNRSNDYITDDSDGSMMKKAENKIDSGYNTVRTAIGNNYNNMNQMDGTTWLWIILAIAAIIIIASVWYYAMQTGPRNED